MRCCTTGFVVASLITAAAGRVVAQPFPLSETMEWIYEVTLQNATETMSVNFFGIASVGGLPTHVRIFSGGSDDGLRQYWSEDVDGAILLHGWDRDGLSVQHNPPIRWVDVPLTVGKTWESTTQSLFGTLVIAFEVVGHGPVTVPAGTFDCATVTYTVTGPMAWKTASYGLTGRRSDVAAGGNGTGNTESYADGIGVVESVFGTSRTDRLVSVSDVVAIRAKTWAAVKALYRDPLR